MAKSEGGAQASPEAARTARRRMSRGWPYSTAVPSSTANPCSSCAALSWQPRVMPEPLLRFSPFQHSTHVFSVGELAVHIAALMHADPVLQDVWLRGEVVNVSRSPAGQI